jgi:hypothetical protein
MSLPERKQWVALQTENAEIIAMLEAQDVEWHAHLDKVPTDATSSHGLQHSWGGVLTWPTVRVRKK